MQYITVLLIAAAACSCSATPLSMENEINQYATEINGECIDYGMEALTQAKKIPKEDLQYYFENKCSLVMSRMSCVNLVSHYFKRLYPFIQTATVSNVTHYCDEFFAAGEFNQGKSLSPYDSELMMKCKIFNSDALLHTKKASEDELLDWLMLFCHEFDRGSVLCQVTVEEQFENIKKLVRDSGTKDAYSVCEALYGAN